MMLVLLVDFCLRYITYYVNRHSFQNFRGKKNEQDKIRRDSFIHQRIRLLEDRSRASSDVDSSRHVHSVTF